MAETVRTFLAQCRVPEQRQRVLAFYGGSFTGIPGDLFDQYLEVASALVKAGVVHGIKASTRPDLIDAGVVARLAEAGFVEIELGAQSLDDNVLALSRRGYEGAAVARAAHMIRHAGLRLGLQLMPGLPGEDRESFKATVEGILALHPDTARIYPTIVLAGTPLEDQYRASAYTPLTLDEAIERSLYAWARLRDRGCSVLRMGLPPGDGLRVVAGPIHPSFGYLVKARGYYHMADTLLRQWGPGIDLRVHPQDVSLLLGHRRATQKGLGFTYVMDPEVTREGLAVRKQTKYACLSVMDIIEHCI